MVIRSVRAAAYTNNRVALEMLVKCYKHKEQDGDEGRLALLLKGKGTPRSQVGACESGA